MNHVVDGILRTFIPDFDSSVVLQEAMSTIHMSMQCIMMQCQGIFHILSSLCTICD